jgi:hypothetical protein
MAAEKVMEKEVEGEIAGQLGGNFVMTKRKNPSKNL